MPASPLGAMGVAAETQLREQAGATLHTGCIAIQALPREVSMELASAALASCTTSIQSAVPQADFVAAGAQTCEQAGTTLHACFIAAEAQSREGLSGLASAGPQVSTAPQTGRVAAEVQSRELLSVAFQAGAVAAEAQLCQQAGATLHTGCIAAEALSHEGSCELESVGPRAGCIAAEVQSRMLASTAPQAGYITAVAQEREELSELVGAGPRKGCVAAVAQLEQLPGRAGAASSPSTLNPVSPSKGKRAPLFQKGDHVLHVPPPPRPARLAVVLGVHSDDPDGTYYTVQTIDDDESVINTFEELLQWVSAAPRTRAAPNTGC
jgi:hypothetical protein